MRHRKAGVKLNRTTSHRNAMFRNMVTSLFKYDRIRTTDAKAKELRRWADNLITLAKRGDLHARRQAMSIVREKDVVHKLFESANERFGNRFGGYTRIIKLGNRPGDAASISLIELVTSDETKKKKKKKETVDEIKTEQEKKPEEMDSVEAVEQPVEEKDTTDETLESDVTETKADDGDAVTEDKKDSDNEDSDTEETKE